jgi:hypothetical protein
MTAAAVLLAELHAMGVELQTDGARLRWRPRDAVSRDLQNEILAQRTALVSVLTRPAGPAPGSQKLPAWPPTHCPDAAQGAGIAACSACRRPLDARCRCWPCCDRLCCDCGQATGSAFVARCTACGHRLNGNRGDPL